MGSELLPPLDSEDAESGFEAERERAMTSHCEATQLVLTFELVPCGKFERVRSFVSPDVAFWWRCAKVDAVVGDDIVST